MKRKRNLYEKYPPSEPCECETCVGYCIRPGWWIVKEAVKAIDSGYGNRMMLEMAPDRSFGVLSPAFIGCEASFAMNLNAMRGCNFLKDQRCELHGIGLQPLECRYCHHDRIGLGQLCHADIEKDWDTAAGRKLIVKWSNLTGLLERYYNSINKLNKLS